VKTENVSVNAWTKHDWTILRRAVVAIRNDDVDPYSSPGSDIHLCTHNGPVYGIDCCTLMGALL